MVRQRPALLLLAYLLAISLLFALAACGPVNSDSPGIPTPNEPAPKPVATYPAAVQTGLIPGAVLTFGPTLPPATAQARASARAATAAHVVVANATKEMVILATWQAVADATPIAEGTSFVREVTTLQAAQTHAAQATQTAFADQTGPGATVVPPSEWGGDGIELHVLTDTVQVRFRCDGGTTFLPLTLDASGAFNLPGLYTSCPAACFGNIPAQFQGQVTGSRLTLNVLWGQDGQINTSGPFTATLGQTPVMRGGCPRCLSGDMLIDTPDGPVPVKNLREGMPVWTQSNDTSASGGRQRATVLKTSRTKAPANHKMMHLVLADGRELLASPGHPMGDGQLLGTLSTGDLINGVRVVSAERVPYEQEFTYDILPSGDTKTYWANGILIGSTLAEPATAP